MAIKTSNQITITEQKRITGIKEWYLATDLDTGVTIGTEGWTTTTQTMTEDKKYLWNYEEIVYSIGSSDVSDPIIIGVYGEAGAGGAEGASLQVRYKSSATIPVIVNNNVSGWSSTVPTPVAGEKIYMTQKLSNETNWSTPIQISASDGVTPTITIIDGYWYVNGEATGIKAEGSDGNTPEITIGNNGNWFINGVDSGTKAQGEAGKDGSDIEYVYYRSKDEMTFDEPPSYTDGVLTNGWTASPQGITNEYKCEYVSIRNKARDSDWSEFSSPVLWSRWGEKGQDGDGVEYKYYLSNSSDIPTYSVDDSNWTDDPQGVSSDNQYEYVVQIKTNGEVVSISDPSLWAKFGVDGAGVEDIINYYYVTQDPELPTDPKWESDYSKVPPLSPTNKYLWNYEEFIYTDTTSKTTTPTIIGVYGDSGTDAVDFQIYSVNGFEFSDYITSIELKTIASQKGEIIKNENDDEPIVRYQWKWWNAESEADDKYENIDGAISSTLTVDIGDVYAFASLKCEMTYDGLVYEDYVSLTNKVIVYTSLVKFFSGNNVIEPNQDYVIAYVELYKDNRLEDTVDVTSVYSSTENSVHDGIINTNITGEYFDGDMMYFIYQDENGYNVALGKYEIQEVEDTEGTEEVQIIKQWVLVESDSKYTYNNDCGLRTASNVFIIPKEKITRALNVNIEICNENMSIIARTNVTIMDLNDPTIGSNPPINPKDGQLWLDTSVSPSILKMWNGNEWVNSGYQNGGAVYTSKPNQYAAGDLWILANDEMCNSFTAGSMLKATTSSNTFDETHWVDALDGIIEVVTNVRESFTWDENGIRIAKRVINENGDITNPFYVHIDSQRMGFHSVDKDGVDTEVVHIGDNSATIKNATFEGDKITQFNNDVVFNNNATFNQQINISKNNTTSGFVWKIEENGSLSLSIGGV